VIAGGAILGWVVGRFHATSGAAFSLVAGLCGRIAVVGVMAYSAERAVAHGGWFIVLAVLFALIGVGAIFTSAVSVGALWMLFTGRLNDD
jgi:hypothetical protein